MRWPLLYSRRHVYRPKKQTVSAMPTNVSTRLFRGDCQLTINLPFAAVTMRIFISLDPLTSVPSAVQIHRTVFRTI